MKIQIHVLLYFLTLYVCNAQIDNITKTLKKCNPNLIKDSISIFYKHNNFTLKLPYQWAGEFKEDTPGLFAYKISNSSKIWLRGYTAYDVQDNNNELKKKEPNFVGINYIKSQEIVIIKHPKVNDKLIHGYEFHCKLEKTPWIWKFYLSTYDELILNDICEIKYIIKQFIQKFNN